MDLEVRHMRVFVALAEELNYTRAAARLHTTQPSVTRTIQQLERIVQCELVKRSSRSLELTSSGEEFASHCRRITNDIDTVLAELHTRNSVRLGFAWLLPGDWFARTLAGFEADGSSVTLHRGDDPLRALADGSIDVAVIRTESDNPALNVDARFGWRRVLVEQRVVAVSTQSPLAHADRTTWEDLRHYPVVVNVVSGTTTAQSWDAPDPNRKVVTCNNFDEWIELVAADRGIGAVPAVAAERAAHPGIVFVSVEDVPPSHVYIAWRPAPPPLPPVRRFLDFATP